MQIDIITLFPEMFNGPFSQSILKRAQERGLIKIHIHNLRDWADDGYKTVDDKPYGGGPGMILRVDVVDRAITEIRGREHFSNSRIVLTEASGNKFNQKKAVDLSRVGQLIIIAGHYEGVDYRVRQHLVDDSISIGNFVLTGGELPCMVIVDATVRLISGVLGAVESLDEESFSDAESSVLEYPQYTRPEEYRGYAVPKVLLSGNHQQINKWRQENRIKLLNANGNVP